MSDEAEIVPGVARLAPLASFEGAGALISAAFAEAGEHLHPEIVTIVDPRDKTQALAVVGRNGVDIIDGSKFGGYRSKPIARIGEAKHTRLDSFIDHVKRFKADNSVVFAVDDAAAPKLTAIFDYHPEGADNGDARFGKHRSVYAFPLSEEWKAWSKANDR